MSHTYIYVYFHSYNLHLVLMFADLTSSTKALYSYFCLAFYMVLQENLNLSSAAVH